MTNKTKAPWPQPPKATADRDALAASLMDEIAIAHRQQNGQAEAFVQVARIAHDAVNETFGFVFGTELERLARARARLAEIAALCLSKEIAIRPRIDVQGVAYIGPLTYVCGGPAPHRTLMLTITGSRGGFYLPNEGIGWIRGHHKPDSPEVKALLARWEQAAAASGAQR